MEQREALKSEDLKRKIEYGLTSEEVRSQTDAGRVNRKVDSSTKSVGDIVRSNVCTYFNLIFLVFAVMLMFVGAWRQMLFLIVIVCNTAIGIIQEVHSKKVLDNLNILSASKIKVLRDGGIKEVMSEELVLGDIVYLEAGNQIPADGVVVRGAARVNESLLTGEADEIFKDAGDKLLSGSFVVSGAVYQELTAVGEESYISKLTVEATQTKEGEQSEMIRSLNKLIMFVGLIIIPIGVTLFVQSYLINEQSLYDSVTQMVAAVIGMIPEGLFLLASVAMAVSAMRLARQQVLIHDMKCIETLARVDVLCVDKTGTITEPSMEVYGFEPMENGEMAKNSDTETSDTETSKLFHLLSSCVADIPGDNATMEALKKHFHEKEERKASRVIGFSSESKYSGAVLDGVNYVIGAPEFLLQQEYGKYSVQMERYSLKGYRVLVFGSTEEELDGLPLQEPIHPLGIVVLNNSIRKGAKETFSYFEERGVKIKVISGDNPACVSSIAMEAGISGADQYVDATTLKTKGDYLEAVEKYNVFGRVTPNQKRHLIQALKQKKYTVAMTGDGVNDVLALRDADCSVAMASGCEAACQASKLVLLDSDFSRMPGVVMEGRRVVNNIERTASLYIVKNIFSMLMAMFSVIFMISYPLLPNQISLIGAFTIGIPSFFLALEPNKEKIKGHFLSNVLVKALPAGFTDFLVVASLLIFAREFQVDSECLSTSCTVLVAIVGFMILYKIAKPITRWHGILIVGLFLGWLFCMFFLGWFFEIKEITLHTAMLTAVFAIIAEPVLRYSSRVVEWTYDKIRKQFP